MIERGYKPFINALFKIINEGFGNWVNNLFAVLWANRFIIRRSTGFIPFYLLYSKEPVLLIKFKIPIWRIFL
jgi:hypothetical protein